jgi:hypothetical protein
VARRLGWRPEFSWGRLAQWAERHGGVRVVERRPMPPMGHFSLIRFERVGQGTGVAAKAAASGTTGGGAERLAIVSQPPRV